jgi:hypothetical protein
MRTRTQTLVGGFAVRAAGGAQPQPGEPGGAGGDGGDGEDFEDDDDAQGAGQGAGPGGWQRMQRHGTDLL